MVAAVAICLAWLAFRAAMASVTDEETEETLVATLRLGMLGAFVGVIVTMVLLLMFGAEARGFLAHAMGRPTSSFTPFRLLTAAVLLGLGLDLSGAFLAQPLLTRKPDPARLSE